MLERIDLLRLWIAYGVDNATRTFSQTLQNIVVEELLGHQTMPTTVAIPTGLAQNLYKPDLLAGA